MFPISIWTLQPPVPEPPLVGFGELFGELPLELLGCVPGDSPGIGNDPLGEYADEAGPEFSAGSYGLGAGAAPIDGDGVEEKSVATSGVVATTTAGPAPSVEAVLVGDLPSGEAPEV